MQQAPPGVVVDRGARALLKEGQHAQADAARVANVAEEAGVLADAGDAKGLAVGADGHDELVVGDIGQGALGPSPSPSPGRRRARDGLAREVVVGVLLDADDLAGEVDVVGPALVELDRLVAAQAPDGLEGGAELEGADGGRGQQRREDKVGARRDDDALVLVGIEGAGKGVTGPALKTS